MVNIMMVDREFKDARQQMEQRSRDGCACFLCLLLSDSIARFRLRSIESEALCGLP